MSTSLLSNFSMMDFSNITPIVLTLNEECNIARCLSMLADFPAVLVVDSGSTDQTLELIRGFSNVRVVHRTFDTHANQWNFAISGCGIKTDWVMALDADYILTDSFIKELRMFCPRSNVVGLKVPFRYCVFGRSLSGSLYPPVTILFRRTHAIYIQDGHTQRVVLSGDVHSSALPIFHDDRKPLNRWLQSQTKYADLEADFLFQKNFSDLRVQDRLRRLIIITPWLVPLFCLFVGRGIVDGKAGLFYALQRCVAESILSLRLLELYLRNDESSNESD